VCGRRSFSGLTLGSFLGGMQQEFAVLLRYGLVLDKEDEGLALDKQIKVRCLVGSLFLAFGGMKDVSGRLFLSSQTNRIFQRVRSLCF
jgi:hypothetical protein